MGKTLVRVLKKRVGRVGPGGTVEVSDRDARVLVAMKLVEIVNQVADQPKAAKTRTYQRRDMVAETAAPAAVPTVTNTEPDFSGTIQVPYDSEAQSTLTVEEPKAEE